MPIGELTKVIISSLIGLIVGYTRKNKPAGMRTFALITLGATIFTIVSISDAFGNTDKTRIIGQIVTGIGFLGAGIIWKGKTRIGGLTTAAAAWVSAAIGILIGLGLWEETAVTTALAILILFSKEYIEKSPHQHKQLGLERI